MIEREREPDRKIYLTRHQTRFITSDADYLGFIGGWGSGKTEAGILKIMELADETPDNLLLICRKEYTDLRDSTMKDFQTYTGLTIGSNKDCKLPDKIIDGELIKGSTIMFRHASELDILKNTNLGGFLMEQIEEFETDDQFTYLCGRVRRDGVKRYGRMVIGNTDGENWVWRLFKKDADKNGLTILRLLHPITGIKQDFKFELIEGTTFECNPDHLPPVYIANLAVIKDKAPAVYNRFVLNSWLVTDTINSLFKMEWIKRAIDGLIIPYVGKTKRIIACDPAGNGGDLCVAYGFENNKMISVDKGGQEIWQQTDATNSGAVISATKLVTMKEQLKANLIALDTCGFGAGIADVLDSMGQPVLRLNGAEKSSKPERYLNLRAEMYAYLADQLSEHRIGLINDELLIEELNKTRFEVKKVQQWFLMKIEDKAELKLRLSRSNDREDACVMGFWALKNAQLIDKDKNNDAYATSVSNRSSSFMSD